MVFAGTAELDIRAIKSNPESRARALQVAGDGPKELWTTLLGYNLIRTTAAAAALLHDKQPRQISFTSACQYVLASWMLFSCALHRRRSSRGLLPSHA